MAMWGEGMEEAVKAAYCMSGSIWLYFSLEKPLSQFHKLNSSDYKTFLCLFPLFSVSFFAPRPSIKNVILPVSSFFFFLSPR